jgi:hypothetical protein
MIPVFTNTTAMLVSLLEGGASALQWDLSATMVVVFPSAFLFNAENYVDTIIRRSISDS